MIHGEWKDCTIDIDRDTEFVGDDVDQYSKLVDLGRHYEKVVILVPTIVSGTVSVYVQEVASTATVPKPLHYRQTSDNATAAWTISTGSGLLAITCDLGGIRYIRLRTGANQTSTDRTFRVMGVRS